MDFIAVPCSAAHDMHQNGFEIVPLISRDLVIVLFIGSLIQQKSEYANRSRELEGKVAKSFAQ